MVRTRLARNGAPSQQLRCFVRTPTSPCSNFFNSIQTTSSTRCIAIRTQVYERVSVTITDYAPLKSVHAAFSHTAFHYTITFISQHIFWVSVKAIVSLTLQTLLLYNSFSDFFYLTISTIIYLHYV